jgi:hypothetical protein
MTSKPNRFIGINYLDIDSKMAVPPEYWLQRLWDFDSDLIVFPSIQTPFAYVLARRARRTGGMNIHDPAFVSATPDTKFCIQRHLLPVSLIYRHSSASWSIDNILRDLRARDIWAAGGGDAYADQADAADERREQQKKDSVRDDMWMRSGDAWWSYKSRAGQTSKTHYGHRSAKATQTA